MEPSRTVPRVPSPVIIVVLNTYLVNGTLKLSTMVARSRKLFRVGFSTVSFGGKIKISLSGLKAFATINTSGKMLNNPKKPRIVVKPISPEMLRFRRLNFLALYFDTRNR
jgi:hypothetical protein